MTADRLNIKRILLPALVGIGTAIWSVGHAQDIESAREQAYSAQATLLAPDLYEDAEKDRARAQKYAAKKPERAAAASASTISLFGQAYQLASQRSVFLENVLSARDLALAAGANTTGNKLWEQGEKSLQKSVSALDKQSDEAARTNAASAADFFAAAELKALQDSTLRSARERLNTADKLKAERYAPITLQRGHDLAAEAEALLQQDRTQLSAAASISRKAEAYADRAAQITQLAKQKPAYEDVILSWDARLDQALQASGQQVPVSLDPELRSAALTTEIERLKRLELELSSQVQNSQQFIAALEDEIRDLDDRLGGASAERRALIMQFEAQARSEEQLEQAKSMFTQNEAQVFTQSGNIVVRLVGLKFASGSGQLGTASESLLRKLGAVIDIYPNSTLVVEGHTDSQGNETGNEQLSQARADAVLNQLVAKMRVAATRISSIGYGESRPIANNETDSGRGKNRRIDLLITPTAPATTVLVPR